MNLRTSLPLAVVTLSLAASSPLAYSSGAPEGFSGGGGEEACVTCHASFGLNTGPGSLTISGPSAFEPGQSYAITVTLQQSGQARWGFQFSPQDQGTCEITDPTNSQVSSLGDRSYVTHTSAGTYPGNPGPASWTFTWTAPASSPATVTLYAAGNATNNDGSPGGDYIYTTSLTLGLVPVELVRFAAAYEDNAVLLRWRTLSERETAGFRVYRSAAGAEVLLTPRLIPGAGTSLVPIDYRFVDQNVRPGMGYAYRLTEVTLSGREATVGTADIRIPSPDMALRVAPTLVDGHEIVTIRADGPTAVEIVDLVGRRVTRLAITGDAYQCAWDLRDPRGLRVPPGAYLCRGADREAPATQFIVVR